jgi:hypothetical protein
MTATDDALSAARATSARWPMPRPTRLLWTDDRGRSRSSVSRMIPLPTTAIVVLSLAWVWAVIDHGDDWDVRAVILGTAVAAVGTRIVIGWESNKRAEETRNRLRDEIVAAVTTARRLSDREAADRALDAQRQIVELSDEVANARQRIIDGQNHILERVAAGATSEQMDDTEARLLANLADALGDAEAKRAIGRQRVTHINGSSASHRP